MIRNLIITFCVAAGLIAPAAAQNYFLYVAAESEDQVHLLHFDADKGKARITETIDVGTFPAENEGPHGMSVSPDGKHWFVTIAHGMPYGQLWKYETGSNKLIGKTELGLFPASMEISEVTGFLYIVNFNLHGEMEPSTVSVVDPETMSLIENVPTGIMPHGSRISPDGRKQYHVSMMTDELIEIDTENLEVSRRLSLVDHSQMDHSMHGSGMNMADGSKMKHNTIVKPTWADPHPHKALVYIAGNGNDEILEVNTESWEVVRRFNAGKGNAPYNLEVSADGKLLVASYKSGAATGVWDLDKGEEIAVIKNTRRVSHGVSISPDSRYAFISVEGIGGEPGSVDVIDLQELKLIDHAETGKQAGGIYFWKMES
jgi:DNA-binding beta-propeller fold protein YncE